MIALRRILRHKGIGIPGADKVCTPEVRCAVKTSTKEYIASSIQSDRAYRLRPASAIAFRPLKHARWRVLGQEQIPAAGASQTSVAQHERSIKRPGHENVASGIHRNRSTRVISRTTETLGPRTSSLLT